MEWPDRRGLAMQSAALEGKYVPIYLSLVFEYIEKCYKKLIDYC